MFQSVRLHRGRFLIYVWRIRRIHLFSAGKVFVLWWETIRDGMFKLQTCSSLLCIAYICLFFFISEMNGKFALALVLCLQGKTGLWPFTSTQNCVPIWVSLLWLGIEKKKKKRKNATKLDFTLHIWFIRCASLFHILCLMPGSVDYVYIQEAIESL